VIPRFPATPESTGSRNHTATVLKVALLALMLAAATALAACSSKTPAATDSASTSAEQPAAEASAPAAEEPAASDATATTVDKLEIKDLKVGKGTKAAKGDAVTVHYTGWLMDGTKFDSSLDRNEPFAFNLGAGEVIAGWDQGVAGMKVGGKRELIIPASLGYGDAGAGGVIPPGATLKFEVTLLAVNGKK